MCMLETKLEKSVNLLSALPLQPLRTNRLLVWQLRCCQRQVFQSGAIERIGGYSHQHSQLRPRANTRTRGTVWLVRVRQPCSTMPGTEVGTRRVLT